MGFIEIFEKVRWDRFYDQSSYTLGVCQKERLLYRIVTNNPSDLNKKIAERCFSVRPNLCYAGAIACLLMKGLCIRLLLQAGVPA
jgi:hypothetical protein